MRTKYLAPKRMVALAIVACSLPVLAACGSGGSTASAGDISAAGGSDPSLVAAAKKEGTVTWYSSIPSAVDQSVADAFKKLYGISVNFIELSSAQVEQRYSAEASSGKIGADIITDAQSSGGFVPDSVAKGYLQPLSQAGLSNYASFPDKFKDANGAVVVLYPWVIAYNTDTIGSTPPPTSWQQLASPDYKGKVLMPDPSVSSAYAQEFDVIASKYGNDVLKGIAALNPKLFASGGPAAQALAAGEAPIDAPTLAGTLQSVMSQGAPIKFNMPTDITTGAEDRIYLTAVEKSQHPKAARLFANYLLSSDAAQYFAADEGEVSPLKPETLPASYVSPPTLTDADIAHVTSNFKQ